MANEMVRNPKKYQTTLGTTNTSTARIDLDSWDFNSTNL
jgi:hypothetical protein